MDQNFTQGFITRDKTYLRIRSGNKKSIFTAEVAQVSKTKEESALGAFESHNHANFFFDMEGVEQNRIVNGFKPLQSQCKQAFFDRHFTSLKLIFKSWEPCSCN